MNALILSGRLTRDFELNNGVARSSIAVDTFKGDTMFVDISVFKGSADFCVKYLRKGDLVLVDGSLNIFKKDTKVYVSCCVSSIQSVGSRKKDEIVDDEPMVVEENQVNTNDDVVSDEDLPF